MRYLLLLMLMAGCSQEPDEVVRTPLLDSFPGASFRDTSGQFREKS